MQTLAPARLASNLSDIAEGIAECAAAGAAAVPVLPAQDCAELASASPDDNVFASIKKLFG